MLESLHCDRILARQFARSGDAQIEGGTAWRQSIERELNAAKCVIVTWSKRSVGPEGNFVRDEASRAMERGTYLPVKIDSSRPPLGFGETQALTLTGWKGSLVDPRYVAIVASVRAVMGSKPIPGLAHRASPATVSRSAVVAGGVVAAAAVAGAGGWLFVKSDRADAANSVACC